MIAIKSATQPHMESIRKQPGSSSDAPGLGHGGIDLLRRRQALGFGIASAVTLTTQGRPAIAQDAKSGRVLMLAWMNQEAYQETISTGYATYYSRSRKRLWRKGEESGHRQKVTGISVDCDADTILLQVEQQGAACHEGFESCFFRRWDQHEWVIEEQRIIDPALAYPPKK